MRPFSAHQLSLFALFALTGLIAANTPSCPNPCQERVNAATSYVSGVIEDNQACTTSSECTTIDPSTDCMGACPVPVNVDGVEEVEAAIDYANSAWCSNYTEMGCPYATPDCVEFEPACMGGICVRLY